MRVIARTSRNTGVSVGPFGLLFLLIGGLIALVVAAVVVLAAWVAAGAMFVVGEVRRPRSSQAGRRPTMAAGRAPRR